MLCAWSVASGGAIGGARSQAIKYEIEYIIEHGIKYKIEYRTEYFLAICAHCLTLQNNNKKRTLSFSEKLRLVLVLKSESHSKNASVGPFCNPWPIQLYVR